MRLAAIFIASTALVLAYPLLLINRKANIIMAQLDDLNTALDAVSTKLDTVKSDVDTVLTELQVANQNPAVDLTATIAKVQAISAKLDGITEEFPSASPAPTTTTTTA